MSQYLLTGAGFSRNWGGWLATEAFEYLLGRPEIVAKEPLRRKLWQAQARGGFEDALADLEVAARAGDAHAAGELPVLRAAVTEMFNDMNTGYESRPSWEFTNDLACSVSKFLTQFDAVFTLNQDLLVELHYLEKSPNLLRHDRWDGAAPPGVVPGQRTASIIGQTWQVQGDTDFKLHDRIQPYFKLHGSANWKAPNGDPTLVIGGNKVQAIVGTPILKWYQQEFEQRLYAGGSKLMIMGYGFRDEHINAAIVKGVSDHGLELFNVSPDGAGHARAVNPTRNAMFHAKPLDDAFERGLIGASRRSLAEIFGSNGNELSKLYRFVQS
jgi:hypothetical protein